MPDILWLLTEDERLQFGLSIRQSELARAPYNRPSPPAHINWPLVERAATELRTETQAFARLLLAAREDHQ